MKPPRKAAQRWDGLVHRLLSARAERAKTAGSPERFAQEALGHNSKAVHRAYAKRALVRHFISPRTYFLLRPLQQARRFWGWPTW